MCIQLIKPPYGALLRNLKTLLMKSIDIFDKHWIDRVFEGRNQAYGAYQLRLRNPRTMMAAFAFGLLLIGALATPAFFYTPPEVGLPDYTNTVVTLSDIQLSAPKINPPAAVNPPAVLPDNPPVQLVNPTVVQAVDAQQNIASNQDNVVPLPAPPGSGSQGAQPETPAGIPSSAADVPPGPMASNLLDKQPEFPGGIDQFREYVARNFTSPATDQATTVRIYVLFVIEADGTMTGIRARTTDPQLEREAIRVLKSLRKKWRPGMLDGQPVAATFTMPILLKIE